MRKKRPHDLAVFGGPSAFDRPIHVGRPHLGSQHAFERRLTDLWNRAWLTNGGPYVNEFERHLVKYLGVEHVIATCNATAALQVLARALGLEGEVLLPAFTFIATAHALEWQQLTPVFCDIDSATHNIDPGDVERKITPRTSAIVGVHLWGRPAPIEELERIARKHHIRLIFDAAHAFGCTYRRRRIGGFGDAEVFSFHATKLLNSFEGGAIATSDGELADRLRMMRNFGFVDYDRVDGPGMNAKMTEVSAAMGLTSLESVEEFIARNREQYYSYQRALAEAPGLKLVRFNEREDCNFHYAVSEIDTPAGLTRDDMHAVLWAENILARRYFFPGCHRQAPYSKAGHQTTLPRTDALAGRVLCLPSGSSLADGDVETIVDLMTFTVANAVEIKRLLQASVQIGRAHV